MGQRMSFIRKRFQTVKGAPVLSPKDIIAKSRPTGVQAIPSVLWDLRPGHSHLDLLLEEELVRWNQEGKWVLCLRLLKTLPPALQTTCESKTLETLPYGQHPLWCTRLTPLQEWCLNGSQCWPAQSIGASFLKPEFSTAC